MRPYWVRGNYRGSVIAGSRANERGLAGFAVAFWELWEAIMYG